LRHAVTNANDISDANSNSHCYGYGDSYGDSNPAGITYTNGNRDSHSYSHRNRYRYGDGHCYSDSYTDIDAEDYANPTASPNTAASSVRIAMVIGD